MSRTGTSMRRVVSGVVLGMLVVIAADASAQTGFDVQQFHPMPGQTVNHFTVASALILKHMDWDAGFILNYADDPLILRSERDQRVVSIVSGQLTLNLLGAVGLFDWLELGADVPLVLLQRGEDAPHIDYTAGGGFGLGDIRLVPRFLLYSAGSEDEPSGVSVGLMATAFLPTGSSEDFQGEGFRVEPRLAFDYAFGTFARISANAGYLFRPDSDFVNVEVDDTLTYGLAISIRLMEQLLLVPEVHGETSLLADEIDPEEIPLEVILGAKVFPIESLLLEAGIGMGIVEGFGTPDWRAFLGICYSPPPIHDLDGDGYPDDEDGCPLEPEDFDRFEDADGCPDPDNDADRILDVDDACPMNPEDRDGFEDIDGCPDPDNDADGIFDVDDGCPMEPEDFDDWADTDGCPDPDNDADGFLDVGDACPNEPESVNGFEDGDGCPDTPPLIEETPCERITLRETVYFDTDSDRIQERSFDLLDQIAGIMLARPDIQLVRIEGHTDSRHSEAYNLDLSQRRAESVLRYLVDRGIDSERFISMGYGESRPITDNRNEAGRAENRRVEFIILRQEGCEDIVPPY